MFSDSNNNGSFGMAPSDGPVPFGTKAQPSMSTVGSPGSFGALSFDQSSNVGQTLGAPSGGIKSVHVTKVSFSEMVEHNTMGYRPFVTNVQDETVFDKLPSFVANNRPGAGFRAESLNSIINDMVQVSANSFGSVPLINGWGIKRFSFMIEAQVVRSNGNAQLYVIEGFTDTDAIRDGGNGRVSIDPNIVLFVNNVQTFGERRNLATGSLSLVPVDTFGVINRDSFQTNDLRNVVTQRPYDVTNMLLSNTLIGNTSRVVNDARSSVATESKTTRSNNNNATAYVAKILNEGLMAMDSTNTDTLFNQFSLRNMIDSVAEPTLAQNGFLREIGKIRDGQPSAATSFSWSDLTALDPSMANPMNPNLMLTLANNRSSFLPSNGFSMGLEDINGSGIEQLWGQTIANIANDILASCGANSMQILANNHARHDSVMVPVMECYNPMEAVQQAQVAQVLFQANVINLLQQQGGYSYEISVYCCMYGDTMVSVNLGHGKYDFLFPNFAHSMYSPVLTNNKSTTEDLSRKLMTVATKVGELQMNQSQQMKNYQQSPI